jgi:hypothetical protein
LAETDEVNEDKGSIEAGVEASKSEYDMKDRRFATMFGDGGCEIDREVFVGDAVIVEGGTAGSGGACLTVVVVGDDPVVETAEK